MIQRFATCLFSATAGLMHMETLPEGLLINIDKRLIYSVF